MITDVSDELNVYLERHIVHIDSLCRLVIFKLCGSDLTNETIIYIYIYPNEIDKIVPLYRYTINPRSHRLIQLKVRVSYGRPKVSYVR